MSPAPAPPVEVYLQPAVVGGGVGDIEEVLAVGRELERLGLPLRLFRESDRPLPRSVGGPCSIRASKKSDKKNNGEPKYSREHVHSRHFPTLIREECLISASFSIHGTRRLASLERVVGLLACASRTGKVSRAGALPMQLNHPGAITAKSTNVLFVRPLA